MGITSVFGKKVAALALAALTLGAGVTMQSEQAEARNGRNAAIAAGVLGALVGGAVIASAANAQNERHYGGGYDVDDVPAPVYHAPQAQPVYYNGPHHGYQGHPGWGHRRHNGYHGQRYGYRGPVCTIQKQRVWTHYGWQFQRVQVCR